MKFETLKNQMTNEGMKETLTSIGIAGALGIGAIVGISGNFPMPKSINIEQFEKITDKLEKFPLIYAIAKHESKLDPFAIGDKHLKNKAYGILQIRQPVIDDVNRIYKTNYSIKDVYPGDHSDGAIVNAVHNSMVIFDKYKQIYNKNAGPEQIARGWNGGGINGPKNPKTVAYWQNVKDHLVL